MTLCTCTHGHCSILCYVCVRAALNNHVHIHMLTHTHRKLTRNEHFELRDLKEILARGNYSKHQAQQAGMVRIPIQDGLMVTNLYYDFVQVTLKNMYFYASCTISTCMSHACHMTITCSTPLSSLSSLTTYSSTIPFFPSKISLDTNLRTLGCFC